MAIEGEPTPPAEVLKEVREYAWGWFALHAHQRMQTFNFFLIAAAFLATAYGTSVSENPDIAAGVAGIGFLVCAAFSRLDYRNRELVKHGEAALRKLEDIYFDQTGWEAIRLVAVADTSSLRFLSTYRRSIRFIQAMLALGFLIASVYAFLAEEHQAIAACRVLWSEAK